MEKNQKKLCNRRDFLKLAAGALCATTLTSCSSDWVQTLLQKHFKEMTQTEIKDMLSRLERQYAQKYHTPIKVENTPPMPNTLFGYGLDLSRCVGCRKCVYACVSENNLSQNPQIHWIRVLEMNKERGVDVTYADPYYDAESVPREGHFYMPVACQQCENPPCVRSCPVGATWKEPDGIVVIDYNWCIGCRCCMSACPYGARHFNWKEPALADKRDPATDGIVGGGTAGGAVPQIKTDVVPRINPYTHYLGNRPRYKGVVEKCTFCIHRVRKGQYPACVEACPVGARKFGNLLDPNSEIRSAIETKRVFIFKEELNTRPSFYYFYSL